MLDAFISYSDFHLKSWIVKIVLVCFVGWSTKNSINSIQQREQQSWADWRGKMIHWTAPGSPVCQCPGQSSHCGSPLCFPARMRDVMMLGSLQCTGDHTWVAIRHWYDPARPSEALRTIRLPSVSRAKRAACSGSRMLAPTEMIWLELWSGLDQILETLPASILFCQKIKPVYHDKHKRSV